MKKKLIFLSLILILCFSKIFSVIGNSFYNKIIYNNYLYQDENENKKTNDENKNQNETLIDYIKYSGELLAKIANEETLSDECKKYLNEYILAEYYKCFNDEKNINEEEIKEKVFMHKTTIENIIEIHKININDKKNNFFFILFLKIIILLYLIIK